MNLDEAIKHCEEVADYDCYNEKQLKCASEYRQFAEWLRELKAVREAWSQLVETVVEIKDNAVDDKDSDSNARDMARFFFNYLRVLEEGIMKEVW